LILTTSIPSRCAVLRINPRATHTHPSFTLATANDRGKDLLRRDHLKSHRYREFIRRELIEVANQNDQGFIITRGSGEASLD
jgi:hypothetical protein